MLIEIWFVASKSKESPVLPSQRTSLWFCFSFCCPPVHELGRTRATRFPRAAPQGDLMAAQEYK